MRCNIYIPVRREIGETTKRKNKIKKIICKEYAYCVAHKKIIKNRLIRNSKIKRVFRLGYESR